MRQPRPSIVERFIGWRKKPPNVIWICADDYAPAVSGTYGSSIASTPNLDRLAAGGIRFDRAYCACPLSTPSRMAFMSGRYPRSVGVTLTPTPLHMDECTIGRLMRNAGYETAAFGKTHYYDPLLREFDKCVDLPEYNEYLATLPPTQVPAGVNILGPWRPFNDPARIWLNADCLPYRYDAQMPDTFFTENAVRYLSEKRSRPFFMWVGFYVTHSPFRFPVEFNGLFRPEEFAVPEVSPHDEAILPPVFRGLTIREKQGIIAAYHTSAAYMDRNVGSILNTLDRMGLVDNTLVIFNSDHGYLLGEHGRFEKHCCFEEAVRSALLMRFPGVIPPGHCASELVELIDILPTILELCGIDIPFNVQGRSLARLIRGDTCGHREHVISEYADNAEAMIRTDSWKLIHSAGNRKRRDGYATNHLPQEPSNRLYHLTEDPKELRDVSTLPENREIVDRLIDLLVSHVKSTVRAPNMLPATEDPLAILKQTLLPFEVSRYR